MGHMTCALCAFFAPYANAPADQRRVIRLSSAGASPPSVAASWYSACAGSVLSVVSPVDSPDPMPSHDAVAFVSPEDIVGALRRPYVNMKFVVNLLPTC